MLKDIREVDTFIEDVQRTLPIQDTYMRTLMKYLCKSEEFYFLPSFYSKETLSPIEELLKELQMLSVDVLYSSKLTRKPGNAEMKYDWHQPKNLCLETISNTTTNPPRDGWMRTAKSNHLIYSFIWLKNILDTFIYDFKRLRDWFWDELPTRSISDWGEFIVPNSPNHTLSRLVPVRDVPCNIVPTYRYLTTSSDVVYPLSPQSNIREFCELQNLPFEVIDYGKGPL
jgi:hypothetical protein